MKLELILKTLLVNDAEAITEALSNIYEDFDFWEFLSIVEQA